MMQQVRPSAFNQDLLGFLGGAPTPYHAVAGMVARLEAAGFGRLQEADEWRLETPGRYFVTRNDGALIAFSVPGVELPSAGFRMVGAHTDSPCLKLKPNPVLNQKGYCQLGAEVYGGALLNPWFDRDLSLAGRVNFRSPAGRLDNALIDFRRPLAVIPSLAIHLDREANENRKVNAQTDMPPVCFQVDGDEKPDIRQLLLAQLRQERPDLDAGAVLDYELFFYDAQPPAVTGMNGDFISSARLDNLLSCHIGLRALLDGRGDQPSLLVCNDHEEVGSASTSGAQGPFLRSVLERLVPDAQSLTRLIHHSMMISCDNAHGVHPNYADRHDGNHGPILNKGPVIKLNANQRYATSSETAALFRHLCEQVGVPVQDFVMRADMACGSTIGPITASGLGVKTVDVGIAQFAMHSIRELCGSRDPEMLYRVLKRFFADQA